MSIYDPEKHLGDVGPPQFTLPKRDEPQLIAGPELHRLTSIHAKVCGGPRRRLDLSPKWVQFYSQFESTEWVTEELFRAMKSWETREGLYPGPGTFNMWLEKEYAGWAKKQQNQVTSDKRSTAASEEAETEKVAKEASQAADIALVDEFHEIPDREQREYRDRADLMMSDAERRFPVAVVQEMKAAELWKSRKG